jgi:hypothetical protein
LGKEGQEIWIVSPVFSWTQSFRFAHPERLCFHIKVSLGVDVGGIDRDMAGPGADCVDITPARSRCVAVVWRMV